jgi:hypothetical protein
MDSEMVRLISKVCVFCEKNKNTIMDCLYVPFHIREGIVKHMELQNVARTLMDQT